MEIDTMMRTHKDYVTPEPERCGMKFGDSSSYKTVKVKRVQNLSLWENFALRREIMKEQSPAGTANGACVDVCCVHWLQRAPAVVHFSFFPPSLTNCMVCVLLISPPPLLPSFLTQSVCSSTALVARHLQSFTNRPKRVSTIDTQVTGTTEVVFTFLLLRNIRIITAGVAKLRARVGSGCS